MPRNNNPEGHNQYTNKSADRSNQSERSASPNRDRDERSSQQQNRSAEQMRDADRSTSGRPSSRS